MYYFGKLLSLTVLFFVGVASAQSSAELEFFNTVSADINKGALSKALADLDAWKEKAPESIYQNERLTFYVQAYAATNQPARALNAARPLISKDLNKLFPGATGQAVVIRLLYSATWAITRLPNPTPEELATGQQAARQLMSYNEPIPGVAREKWAEVQADMKEKASSALLYLAMLPGVQAMTKNPPDCTAAEASYTSALVIYPEKAILSYELGRALNCEAKADPGKMAPAIYQFERAAALDPTLGDAKNDPRKIQAVGDNAYIKLHGSDAGLKELQQMAKHAPLPPADFKIKTATEIEDEKQAAFENTNPQLALWIKVKARLMEPGGGEEYFEDSMKGTAVPEFSGILMEAKPACRPNELVVAIPMPNLPLQAELRLKLDRPLDGKPDLNASFHWEGVPTDFTREPFLLTMAVEKAKIQGLTTKACRRP